MAEFFVNYARANNDLYLQQFVQDLREVVRDRRGLSKADEVDFFDQRDIELGALWDDAIVAALRTVNTLVSIASPAFFKSDYCGRERALFRRRFPAKAQPPLIKPIVWIPFGDAHLPPSFQAAQFTFGDPDAVHNTRGVKYMLQRIQKYKDEYTALVADFGAELIAAADQHGLPPLAAVPALASVQSEWHAAGSARAAAAPAATGPKHVRFVYFALDPGSLGPTRLKEPYLDQGGVDWKPFYPEPTPIHLFAQKTVISDELGFTSDYVPFGADLLDQINSAWEARQIVVIVIDPWSLHWDAQSAAARQRLLQTLDERNAFHWCVLVPWNEQDPDLRDEPQRSTIASTVTATFPFHGRLNKNPMFFRDGIKSLGELKQALTEVLPRLKDEIRKQADVKMPIPEGPAKVVMRASPAAGPVTAP